MSNMVVANNLLATNAHRNLKTVGAKQSQASARLSSGYRINSAADDAAGLAISEKMRAQIRGLDMASKNAQDGISLIQTAEGGMQEIDNMLQRIRELVDQAANDTNENNTSGTGDRQKIQDEINQLVQEIDSMAERVEFNKKKVINGSYADIQSQLANAKEAFRVAMAESQTISEEAKSLADGYSVGDLTALAGSYATLRASAGSLYGSATTKSGSILDKQGSVGDKANSAANKAGSALDKNASYMTKKASADIKKASATAKKASADSKTSLAAAKSLAGAAGSANKLRGSASKLRESASKLGSTDNKLSKSAGNLKSVFDTLDRSAGDLDTSVGLLDMSVKLLQGSYDAKIGSAEAKDASAELYRQIINAVMEENGMSGGIPGVPAFDPKDTLKLQALSAQIEALENKTQGSELYFQVGANAHQGITVNIGSAKSDLLGIGDGDGKTTIDIVKDSGKDITGYLDVLDVSLSYITTERSKLGATQNRLDYTIKSLDISSENLQASESRIRDTDMAKEMMKLTQANVLQQAATSILAQANQAPQNILQLLG